jgi:hypothetical protein
MMMMILRKNGQFVAVVGSSRGTTTISRTKTKEKRSSQNAIKKGEKGKRKESPQGGRENPRNTGGTTVWSWGV